MINIIKQEGEPRDNIDFENYVTFVEEHKFLHKKISCKKYFEHKLSILNPKVLGYTDRNSVIWGRKEYRATTYSLGCFGYKNIKNLIAWYFDELKKIEEDPKFRGWFVRIEPKIEKDYDLIRKHKRTAYKIYGRLVPIYD